MVPLWVKGKGWPADNSHLAEGEQLGAPELASTPVQGWVTASSRGHLLIADENSGKLAWIDVRVVEGHKIAPP